jgi:ketosteroid isomerase-like protein
MASDRILELLRRPVDLDEYTEIRELWKTHSIAEDNRDLPGLISTLTEDCVYEVVGTGARWEGHDGAARFYTELLTAFPDIHFDLEYIVIGPQGVCEEARVTATIRASGSSTIRPASASSGGTQSSSPGTPPRRSSRARWSTPILAQGRNPVSAGIRPRKNP